MPTTETPLSPDYGTRRVDGDVVTEPTPNARQGAIHHNVRIVLAVSTAAAIVALGAIYLFFFSLG